MTATARNAAIAPLTSQRARVSGVARTSSRRPPVSSDAHFETSVAAANPAAMKNSSTKTWRKPPADVRSKPGKTVCRTFRRFASPASWADIGPTSDARSAPMSASPRPHQIARGSCSPNARLIGPRTPSTAAGSCGSPIPSGDPEVAAREQLDADRQERDADDADQGERRPVELADERDVVLHPAERAQERQRAHVEPVADHADARGRCPTMPAAPARPSERREREGEAAEEQRDEPEPEREADRRGSG